MDFYQSLCYCRFIFVGSPIASLKISWKYVCTTLKVTTYWRACQIVGLLDLWGCSTSKSLSHSKMQWVIFFTWNVELKQSSRRKPLAVDMYVYIYIYRNIISIKCPLYVLYIPMIIPVYLLLNSSPAPEPGLFVESERAGGSCKMTDCTNGSVITRIL